MNPCKKAYCLFRYLGPRVVGLRAKVYLHKALGVTKRLYRPRPWEQIDLKEITAAYTPADPANYARFKRRKTPAFLFPLGRPPPVPEHIRQAAGERRPNLNERLRLLAEDRGVYFFHAPSPRPIDWYANPFDGTRGEADKSWWAIPDFLPRQGDVRTLWEPARAAWAIDLARAKAHGLNCDAGPLFWRWLDSWMRACPPFTGVHWKCGQEAAVRFLAVTLGFWSLADEPATTPERWVQWARLAWATGYRIYHHLDYAVSQKNNHAISEACGLLLISLLFPEFRDAPRWQAAGRSVLLRELRRQIYPDGSYLQHSMNYHRVMLQMAMLALRLAELAGLPFDREIYERLGHSGEFLFQMMDLQTGRLPQYGHNDGALVWPLNECAFNDYRPVVQAAHYLHKRKRLLPPGPWDEDLLWLFGPQALAADSTPREPVSSAFPAGGYYTLRQNDSWAMIRCPRYRDRPGQYDQLHLDLWWRGQNVLADCGSYRYYVPSRPDVEYYFKSAAAHNTVQIDGRDPLELVSRFLWLPWPRGEKRHFDPSSAGAGYFEGQSADYDRAPWRVLHRRAVIGLANTLWLVIDDLLGRGEHDLALRWHLLDMPYEADVPGTSVRLQTPAGDLYVQVVSPSPPRLFEVVRGRDESGRVQGWAAPYYAERVPIPTLEATWRSPLPRRIITIIAPDEAALFRPAGESANAQRWALAWQRKGWRLELAPPDRLADKILLSCVSDAP